MQRSGLVETIDPNGPYGAKRRQRNGHPTRFGGHRERRVRCDGRARPQSSNHARESAHRSAGEGARGHPLCVNSTSSHPTASMRPAGCACYAASSLSGTGNVGLWRRLFDGVAQGPGYIRVCVEQGERRFTVDWPSRDPEGCRAWFREVLGPGVDLPGATAPVPGSMA